MVLEPEHDDQFVTESLDACNRVKKSSLCRLFQEVVLLLTTLVILRVETQKCRDGWFGANCTYQCKCSGPNICGSNGICDSGTCAPDYFGDTCQYLDVVSRFAIGLTPSFVRDKNDSSCNTDPSASTVSLELGTAHLFQWFRIIFRAGTLDIYNFKANINKARPCSSERKFPGDNFVDVTCFGLRTYIKNLDIVGDIARNICSIYISIGRNVAVKQTAKQSSNNLNPGQVGYPKYAVDGNANPKFAGKSCSQTHSQVLAPSWDLVYSQEQILLYIKITNRDEFQIRLSGFTVSGWNESGYKTFTYTDTDTRKMLASYLIPLSDRIPTSRLQILGGRKSSSLKFYEVLTLCEVETFGETVCPDGTYGLNCEEQCHCAGTDICNQVTGICAKGCPDGFYGYECKFRCSPYCAHNLCYQRTAHCLRCNDGFIGPFCTIACSPGRYGHECKMNCSSKCLNVCDNVDGTCTCKNNFAPPTCDECVIGRWGPGCAMDCFELCEKLLCERDTGYCVECPPNRKGLFCRETLCTDGAYGADCDKHCFCNRTDVCDKITGVCEKGCPDGYYGYMCNKRCSTSCANNLCYQRRAYCLRCKDGYIGDFCNIACNPGRYGQECKLKCSSQCVNVCDHINGSCPCKENFAPPTCQGCVDGKWGNNCTNICFELCDKHLCNKVTGYCDGCSAQRRGTLCSDCAPKFFGRNCDLKCSVHCLNGECDQRTGSCPICTENYSGERCTEEGSNFPFYVWFIALAVVGLLLVVVGYRIYYTSVEPQNVASTTIQSSGSESSEFTEVETNI